jgi:hypothetical protein
VYIAYMGMSGYVSVYGYRYVGMHVGAGSMHVGIGVCDGCRYVWGVQV